jgi:hypothetical protein
MHCHLLEVEILINWGSRRPETHRMWHKVMWELLRIDLIICHQDIIKIV